MEETLATILTTPQIHTKLTPFLLLFSPSSPEIPSTAERQPPNHQHRTTDNNVGVDPLTRTPEIDAIRSANSYSPPPLFANTTTTLTLADITAAAHASGGRLGQSTISHGEEGGEDVDGDVRKRTIHHPNGNAQDFVVASKRRRRIEIPRIAKKNGRGEGWNAAERMGAGGMDKVTANGSSSSSASASYNNFCAGGLEFTDKQQSQHPENGGEKADKDEELQRHGGESATQSNDSDLRGAGGAGSRSTDGNDIGSDRRDEKPGESTASHPKVVRLAASGIYKEDARQEVDEQPQIRRDIKSIADLVGGKMKFLSEGRPPVSGVQAMAIQLEVSGDGGRVLLIKNDELDLVLSLSFCANKLP